MPIDFDIKNSGCPPIVALDVDTISSLTSNLIVSLSFASLTALKIQLKGIVDNLKSLGLTENAILHILQEVHEMEVLDEGDAISKDVSIENR